MTSWQRRRARQLRTLAWTFRAARAVRRAPGGASLDLRVDPPRRPDGAMRPIVVRGLGWMRETCLTRALVLQSWDVAHDAGSDVVIGVRLDDVGFAAHAWLEGESTSESFVEILRRTPRPAPVSLWQSGPVTEPSGRRIVRIPAHVAFEPVGGEGVVLDLVEGQYFRLNTVAARFWEILVDNGGDIADARDRLLEEFAVDATTLDADLASVVAALAERRLILVES